MLGLQWSVSSKCSTDKKWQWSGSCLSLWPNCQWTWQNGAEPLHVFVFTMDPHSLLPWQLLFLGSSKIKAVYTILKTLQYIHRFHNTLCALGPLLHHYHISTVLNPCVCVCIVRMLLCVHACVYTYVCVASTFLLFHKVFFKSDF